MNYEEAIEYIHSVSWKGSRPGLSRITELMKMLGDPQDDIKTIHVAGTNGKGSFCAMLDCVLRKSGYKTGLFVSPYIEFFEERIQYNGDMISKDDLCKTVERVKEAASQMSDVPTEFEILTAIGFCYFKEKNVDVAIIECGMGGRLDSTNIIKKPILSVITGIALDHTAFLGDTEEKIAQEKAGIIKENVPVLYGGKDGEAEAVIREKANELGSEYVKKSFKGITKVRTGRGGCKFTYKNKKNVRLKLIGAYQPENASNVIEAVEILKTKGFNISHKALKDGLYNTVWKGRFERLNDTPEVYFDGGHNEEGVKAAVRSVKSCFGKKKINIISGVLADKDYMTMASELKSVAKKVYTVTPDNIRALKAEDYADTFKSLGTEACACEDFFDAVEKAMTESASSGTPILCVGSLYSYPDFKKALTQVKKDGTIIRKAKEKRLVKRLITVIPCLIALLLCLNLVLESGILSQLFGTKIKYREYPPISDLCEPDFEYNIFENEEYMAKSRGFAYTKDGVQEYLKDEDEIVLKGEVAVFFKKYFDAVINGDADTLNGLLSQDYIKKNGEYEPFTMQMLYDMEVIFLQSYYLNEGSQSQILVYEFDVGYRIMNNNGTFRNNLASDDRRDVRYTLCRYSDGEIKIQKISEYLMIIN